MNTRLNEHELRQLAYRIWESEGKPAGQADRHWEMALAQAEAGEDQYVTGESFLGDRITPANETAIVGENPEFTRLTETELDTLEAETLSPLQQPLQGNVAAKKADKRKKVEPAFVASADAAISSKKRPGKKKSSDNLLV